MREGGAVTTARRAGRPSTAVLSEERILKAAFRLSRNGDPRAFTMTALAQSLGVRTSALYHHFADRDAVIRAMRAHLTALADASALATAPVEEGLRAWGRNYREAALSAPSAIVMLATLPIDADDASFAQYEDVTVALERAGWPQDRIVDTIVALESFVIGSALDALAPADNMDPGDLAAAYPRFAAAEQARATPDAATRTFEIGLAALVSGLHAWALGD
jgi:AcrR family transcriptional regulator